jgi:hypothetical protein
MRIKGDTISYNLQLDGTENKIEDVIKNSRTRGDMDGKVLYKGQQINNVLMME